MATGTLACPVCGDPEQPVPMTRVVRCLSCSAALYVEQPPMPHVMVEPRIDREQAKAKVKAWMRGARHRELLAWRAKLEPPRLVYLPFARIEATVLGTVYGTRKHEHADSPDTWEDVEIEIAEELDTVEPLSTVGELGVERLPALADVATVPFDDAAIGALGAEHVPALDSGTTATDRAHAAFTKSLYMKQDINIMTGNTLTVVEPRETCVHYPFWRVDYRVGRATYIAVVDARSGEIAYGRAPGSTLFHSAFYGVMMPIAAVVMMIGFLVAGLLFDLGEAAGQIFSKLEDVCGAAGCIVAIGGIALGVWVAVIGHRGLQQAGEVESGYGVHAGAELFDVPDTAYEADRAAEQAEVDKDPALVTLETSA
jgi:hypothetical protein